MNSWPPTFPHFSCSWCHMPPHISNLSILRQQWLWTCPYYWWPPLCLSGDFNTTLGIINIHHQLLFSVMEKLPATSYVRLVDVWLIFGQLLPFIEEATFYTPDLIHVLIYLFKGGVIHNCWALQWWRYNQSSWFSKEGDYRISEEHSCNAINDLQCLQNSKSVG